MAACRSLRVMRWAPALLVSLLTVALPGASRAQAPPPGSLVPTWGVNGTVQSLTIDGSTLYVGGRFDYVGPPTGSFGVVDAGDPSAINTAARVTGGVGAITSDGSGGWFVLSPGGMSQQQILRILPSGQRDPTWAPPVVIGTATTLVRDGGRLFVAGFLTAVNDVPRTAIAAMDVATGAVLPWDARLTSSTAGLFVTDVAIAAGRVFVAGAFSHADGRPRHRLAVFDAATAAVLPLVLPDDAGPGVAGLGISSGRVYVSAFFGNTNPTVRAYDLDLVPLPAWTTPPVGFRLLATPTALFNVVFTSPGDRVEARDPETGALLPFAPVNVRSGDDAAWVQTMAVGDGRLYIGGSFQTANGQPRAGLVAVDAVTGAPTSWGPRVGHGVNAIVSDGGRVAVGGSFVSIGGIAQRNFVALDLRTGRPTSPLAPSLDFTVRAVQVLGDVVVAGGEPSASPRSPDVVAYSRASGALLPWSLSSDGYVSSLATDGRELFIGGGFSALSGAPRRSLASVDLQTAVLTSWNPGVEGTVSRLVTASGGLYVMGGFDRAGADWRPGVAAFDTGSRTLLPFSPAPGQFVDMGVQHDRVLLSGAFFPPGGGVSAFRWVDGRTGVETSPSTPFAGLGGRIAVAGATAYALAGNPATPGRTQLLAIDGLSGLSTVYDLGYVALGPLAASADYIAASVSSEVTSTEIVQGLAVFRAPGAGAPRGLTARLSASTVTLGWQSGPPPAATGYVVEAGTSPGVTDVGSFAVGAATQVSGALPAGTFFIRVRAATNGSPGAASSVAIVTIPAVAAPPATPGTLTGSVASGMVSLSWGAASGNSTTYVIEAGTGAGLANIITFPTGHLDTTFSALVPSGTYVVRIRAANAFGVSPPTNEVTLVVP